MRPRGIASLTGYEGEEPRISGMDVNYPDQIVSLFATGIVIAAVMEARRSGKGCVPRLLPARGRVLHPGRGDSGGLGRSGTPARPARQHAKRAWPSRTPIAARTGAGSPSRSMTADPALDAFCAARDSDDAVAALLARGIAAAPCNDGADLLRDTRPRRRHAWCATSAAGWSRACPIGSTARASPSSAPRPISASTPTRCCASFWATATPSWRN